ncbi:MAG: hypothetical protein AB1634_18795 [Thermodesulfobacteriota bacterium]
MSAHETKKPGKPYGKTLVYGALATALYSGVFLYGDEANTLFAQGGAYAFLPIVTALVFSWAHGNFTGNFWTMLGVEASKKTRS